MARSQRKLDSTVLAVQSRYGPQALRRGTTTRPAVAAHLSTGFAQLDALTGCGGVPLGALTLLSGRSTSGKLTLAYKLLAQAQVPSHTVALLDLTHSADPDYLSRCGVDLVRLVMVRPSVVSPNASAHPKGSDQGVGNPDAKLLHLLLDLARSRQVRLLVVDGLAELTSTRELRRALPATLRRLPPLLRAAGCGVVLLDEPAPPWQRRLRLDTHAPIRLQTALHFELQRERWLQADGRLTGYMARAQLLHSRWAAAGRSATVEFVFNGTVRARDTW